MRQAVFAGKFYPENIEKLYKFFNNIYKLPEKKQGFGLVVPHAGYIYSGETAFKTFNSIEINDTCVILCPNHRGLGEPIGVSTENWDTPLGVVEIDEDLTTNVLKFPFAMEDSKSHKFEHSLEVQLPILKYLYPSIKIVAISVGIGDLKILNEFSNFLSKILDKSKITIIASSDMSHFISSEKAKELDYSVIKKLEKLEPEKMLSTVISQNISMCGVFPAYIVSSVCKQMGATAGEVIEYTNSGVVTGDYSDVVAYLGMRFV